MKPLLLLVTFAVIPLLALADEKEAAAKLAGKGIRLDKDPSGSVTDIRIYSKDTITADDYLLFAQFPKLHKLWMSPGGQRLNDATVASIGVLPNLDYFFGGSAHFTDEGIKAFSSWKNLKYFGLDHWFGPEGSKGYVGGGLAH